MGESNRGGQFCKITTSVPPVSLLQNLTHQNLFPFLLCCLSQVLFMFAVTLLPWNPRIFVAMKGKQIAGKGLANSKGKGKRKRGDGGDKSGVADRKRKNPTGVLKFFDNAAAEANNDSDASDDDDFRNGME